jgi:hypothetical protein
MSIHPEVMGPSYPVSLLTSREILRSRYDVRVLRFSLTLLPGGGGEGRCEAEQKVEWEEEGDGVGGGGECGGV